MENYLDLGPFKTAQGTVQLPGSKSISNRVLLLAALSRGKTLLRDVLDSDDTQIMLSALKQLGVCYDHQEGSHDYVIEGTQGNFPVKEASLFMGNAGTAIRPLAAVLGVLGGHYQLDGVPRMRERPIGDLVDGLGQLNIVIEYLGQVGFPPLRIQPQIKAIKSDEAGSKLCVRGNQSSQFLSALLMALPLLPVGKERVIEVEGELISKPYVDLTIQLMARFGVEVQRDHWQRFWIEPQVSGYESPGELYVEADASSASYFLAAAALSGGPVRIEGVGADSIQGDIRFAEVLKSMGVQVTMGKNWIEARGVFTGETLNSNLLEGPKLKGQIIDCLDFPDAAMTLAILALACDKPCRLDNIGSWRVKETDRIVAMATELRKLGATVNESNDHLTIYPINYLTNANQLRSHIAIDTYDDHRMAMCFSLISLLGVPVRINQPECVSKTFPHYFEEFNRIVSK